MMRLSALSIPITSIPARAHVQGRSQLYHATLLTRPYQFTKQLLWYTPASSAIKNQQNTPARADSCPRNPHCNGRHRCRSARWEAHSFVPMATAAWKEAGRAGVATSSATSVAQRRHMWTVRGPATAARPQPVL